MMRMTGMTLTTQAECSCVAPVVYLCFVELIAILHA
jgi:hypothetical protein